MAPRKRITSLCFFGLSLTLGALGTAACGGGDGASGEGSSGSGTGGSFSTLTNSSNSGSGGTSGSSGSSSSSSETSSSSSSSSSGGSASSTTTNTSSETTGTATTGAGGAFGGDPLELCGGTCECGNGIDDDGDGKIDGFDEECTGAADDDEGSFATGISGDNKDPKWQDCFFDGNSGAGDDGCRYHTDCLLGDKEASDQDCTVTDSCIEYCQARTPNGCDCFGCCEVDTQNGPVNIYIIESCDLENIDDEDACPRCVPSTQCENECGECELCPGKDTLPESCEDDTPVCDNDLQACTETAECPDFHYCQLGCCTPITIN